MTSSPHRRFPVLIKQQGLCNLEVAFVAVEQCLICGRKDRAGLRLSYENEDCQFAPFASICHICFTDGIGELHEAS